MGRALVPAALSALLLLAACGTPAATRPAAPGPTASAKPATASKPAASPKPAATPGVPKIVFTFDFIPNGSHAPFYAAAARGYYKAQGLDVTVREGVSATDTTDLIVTGRAQFGWDPAGTVALAVAKGADLRSVAAIYATNTLGLVYRQATPIHKPADVYGKVIGVPAGTNAQVDWREFLAVNHLDVSRVKVLNIRPTVEAGLMGKGKLDAFSGGSYTFMPLAKKLGLKVGYLPYQDSGVGGMAEGLVTTGTFIRQHPAWVRKFLYATAQGYAFAAAHPRRAAAYMVAKVPQMTVALAAAQLKLAFPMMKSPNTQGKPWGWQSAKDWQAELNLLHRFQGLKQPLPPSRYFTNQFLPTGPVSAP